MDMGKIAVILGLVVAFAIGAGFLYSKGDARACRKAPQDEIAQSAGEGWKRYINCEYGFAVNVPSEYRTIHAEEDSALFPFRAGELLQIIFTDEDPEHAYTVRILERTPSDDGRAEVLGGFEAAMAANSYYSFERQWLKDGTDSMGGTIEQSFSAFEPAARER